MDSGQLYRAGMLYPLSNVWRGFLERKAFYSLPGLSRNELLRQSLSFEGPNTKLDKDTFIF